MYKLHVNEQDFFDLDGIPNWDLKRINDNSFHIIKDNKSYPVSLVDVDPSEKTFLFKINQREYSVQLKDKFDLLIEKLGLQNMNTAKANNIKAPMPGLVLDVFAETGQVVKKGDSVLILEAMKMENVIKAPGDGTIKSILIEKGEAVEKNQLLIELS